MPVDDVDVDLWRDGDIAAGGVPKELKKGLSLGQGDGDLGASVGNLLFHVGSG